jgi:hypothetical protein
VTKPSVRTLDPESVCTRVVARLIEEIACVDIAPDSPVWSDLKRGEEVIGELRIYRGRGRVQKVVSSRYTLAAPVVDSHSVLVFTQPESPVPHFALESVQLGCEIHLYVDLLPKRDLAVALPYLDRCYAPLSPIVSELERDARFRAVPVSLRHRALLSPWHVLSLHDPHDLEGAQSYVDRYVSHWASLLRSHAPELDSSPELATRDIAFRKTLFSRAVDPSWALRDRTIGRETVDRILAALSS